MIEDEIEYCKSNRSNEIIRIKDGYVIGQCFDKDHADTTVKLLNHWNALGWPLEDIDD